MASLLIRFEEATGLNATQAALLLGCPRPTYYQYRRTDDLPSILKRSVEFALTMPDETLQGLISKYVYNDL